MGNSKSGDVLICGLQPAEAVLGAESSQVLLKIHFNLLVRLSVEDGVSPAPFPSTKTGSSGTFSRLDRWVLLST